MKRFLTFLILGLFLTAPIFAQGTIDEYRFTLAQGTADYGFTLAQGEANVSETVEPVAYINYLEEEAFFRNFEKVELNIIIQEGNEINTTANGRVEILLRGGGVIRLDRNTRVVFATLTDQIIILEAWSGNIYVEKGDLEIGIKSPGRSLNLSQSEWYLKKPEKNFKKWNSKREKELMSEPEYGYDYRSYGGYGYGYPYYGYGFRLCGGYYPYYGYYGYYYPYYGYGFGLYGGYYPYYYGYGYRNYNFYGYSSREYGYDSYGRGQTVIHKNQLKRRIPGNVSSSHFKTSFSAATSRSASVSKSTGQISPKNNILKHSKHSQFLENKQRTKITTQERKKIQTYPSRIFSIPKFTGGPVTRKTYSPNSGSIYKKPYSKSPKKYIGFRSFSGSGSKIFSKSSKSYPKSGPSFSSSTRSSSRSSQGKGITSGKVVKKK